MDHRIPATVPHTVDGYMGYLSKQIERANDHWDHYGKVISAAYATAYDDHQRALNYVQQHQRAQKDADEAAMSFLLSLLTVGVAGAAAGAFARSISENSKPVEDAAKDMVKDVLKGGVSRLGQALSPDRAVSNDVFAPADISPSQYMAKILEGISYCKTLLDDILDEAQWDPNTMQVKVPDKSGTTTVLLLKSGGQLTVDSAKKLAEVILNTSYFQQMPPREINSQTLTPKASLAMWIGWALNRDPVYWYNAKQTWYRGGMGPPGRATREQVDWLPIRRDLAGLGVPGDLISSIIVGAGLDQGLYMWGFMKWAASKSSLDLLFDRSLPKNSLGFEMVVRRKARRMLLEYPPMWLDLSG